MSLTLIKVHTSRSLSCSNPITWVFEPDMESTDNSRTDAFTCTSAVQLRLNSGNNYFIGVSCNSESEQWRLQR